MTACIFSLIGILFSKPLAIFLGAEGNILDMTNIYLKVMITEVAAGIVMIIFNMLILGIEENTGVAAYGVIANLALVFSAIYTGIAQGVQPLISEGYGKNDVKQIKVMYRYALITLSVISIAIYTLSFIFADPITAIFNSEQNEVLQEIAVKGMKLYFTAVPFIGFNIVTSVFLSAIERVLPAQSISLLRGIILMVPMAYLLAAVYGMTGIWLTVPVTEGIVTGLGIIFIIKWWKQSFIKK